MSKHFLTFLCLITLIAPPPRRAAAATLGRGFTYQGQLQQAGVPVEGHVSLRFSLWDAAGSGTPPTGGTMIGATQAFSNIAVTGGVFSALLNAGDEFGAQAFNGEARWLQVEVCTDSTCASSTVLGPRQPITGAPYALGPWQLNGAHLSYTQGNVGVGTSAPLLPLHVKANGEAMRTEGTTTGDANVSYIGFSAPGGALTGYVGDASVNDGDMYVGSQSRNVNLYAGGFVMTAQSSGRVGIGTYTPASKLEVRGDIRLGSFGEYFAPSGTENLRIVRGIVNSAGTILEGSGFTATRTAVGRYTITFATGFTANNPPAVTVSGVGSVTTTTLASLYNPVTTTAIFVRTTNAAGTETDGTFHFIAMGPR